MLRLKAAVFNIVEKSAVKYVYVSLVIAENRRCGRIFLILFKLSALAAGNNGCSSGNR